MFHRHVAGCVRERAGDGSLLCELVHPYRESHWVPFRPSIAHAIVLPGESTLPHRLRQSTEVTCIIAGRGRMHVDRENEEVGEGSVVLVPPRGCPVAGEHGKCPSRLFRDSGPRLEKGRRGGLFPGILTGVQREPGLHEKGG
ncbi:MAG: cupin domain-containing protein [Methanolinea sp.]|nr:cupin domain-containing protein [Methanolinea sp.]